MVPARLGIEWYSVTLCVDYPFFRNSLFFHHQLPVDSGDLGLLRVDVENVLAHLTDREIVVLKMRYGIGVPRSTLESVGRRINLTRERVRQIQLEALDKLREKAPTSHKVFCLERGLELPLSEQMRVREKFLPKVKQKKYKSRTKKAGRRPKLLPKEEEQQPKDAGEDKKLQLQKQNVPPTLVVKMVKQALESQAGIGKKKRKRKQRPREEGHAKDTTTEEGRSQRVIGDGADLNGQGAGLNGHGVKLKRQGVQLNRQGAGLVAEREEVAAPEREAWPSLQAV